MWYKVIASVLMWLMGNALLSQCPELVPNGGFESFTQLPNTGCDWFLADGWDNAAVTANCNSSNGTPDYYHSLGSGNFSELPDNYFAQVQPFEGSAVMGIAGYLEFFSNAREYVSRQLTCPMTVGQVYALDYAITMGTPNQDSYFSDGWGVLLSETPSLQPAGTNSPITIGANDLFIPIGGVVDDLTWRTVVDVVTADRPYAYFTFGNFLADNAQTRQNQGNPGNFDLSYYFVDAFSIRPQTPLSISNISIRAELNTGVPELSWTIPADESVKELHLMWSRDGLNWTSIERRDESSSDSLEGIHRHDIAPAGLNYYQLRTTDPDGVTEVSAVKSVEVEGLQGQLTAYPIPTTGLLFLEYENIEGAVLKDGQGRDCMQIELNEDAGVKEVDVSELSPGLYFLNLKGGTAQRVLIH